ncbi:MAG: hypothetical protein JWL63_121 [Rhodocyclales bacterium]|nr:hypothetical protein [Rhodocyclales bacterium]
MAVKTDPDKDRDFRTYIPDALWNEYFMALGKFFHAYARVENDLHVVLSNLLEEAVFPSKYYRQPPSGEERVKFLQDPLARTKIQREASLSLQRRAAVRAVLGSMRLKPMKDSFNRLLSVTNADDAVTAELDRIFAHLGDIQSIRDRLAHNGATPDMRNKENWFYTSDHLTQNLQEKSSTIYFKANTLLDMARDLTVIPDLIFNVFNPDIRKAMDNDPAAQTPEIKAHLTDVRGPFRYKSTQLKRESRRTKPTTSPAKRTTQ